MPILVMFLMVLGAVLFFLVAVGIPNPPSPRFNLIGAGLFCWIIAELLVRVPLLR